MCVVVSHFQGLESSRQFPYFLRSFPQQVWQGRQGWTLAGYGSINVIDKYLIMDGNDFSSKSTAREVPWVISSPSWVEIIETFPNRWSVTSCERWSTPWVICTWTISFIGTSRHATSCSRKTGESSWQILDSLGTHCVIENSMEFL